MASGRKSAAISCRGCEAFARTELWWAWFREHGRRSEPTLTTLIAVGREAYGGELRGRGGRRRQLAQRGRSLGLPIPGRPVVTTDVLLLRWLVAETGDYFAHLREVRGRDPVGHLTAVGAPLWLCEEVGRVRRALASTDAQWKVHGRAVTERVTASLSGYRSGRTIRRLLRDVDRLDRAEHTGWRRALT